MCAPSLTSAEEKLGKGAFFSRKKFGICNLRFRQAPGMGTLYRSGHNLRGALAKRPPSEEVHAAEEPGVRMQPFFFLIYDKYVR